MKILSGTFFSKNIRAYIMVNNEMVNKRLAHQIEERMTLRNHVLLVFFLMLNTYNTTYQGTGGTVL